MLEVYHLLVRVCVDIEILCIQELFESFVLVLEHFFVDLDLLNGRLQDAQSLLQELVLVPQVSILLSLDSYRLMALAQLVHVVLLFAFDGCQLESFLLQFSDAPLSMRQLDRQVLLFKLLSSKLALKAPY